MTTFEPEISEDEIEVIIPDITIEPEIPNVESTPIIPETNITPETNIENIDKKDSNINLGGIIAGGVAAAGALGAATYLKSRKKDDFEDGNRSDN